MPHDFSPPAFKRLNQCSVRRDTDAFRRWEAKATPKEKQEFADGMNAIAAGLRETPLRTEVTVLGPDDPNQKPLGWSMYERLGTEICKRSAIGTPLKEGDIAAGEEVLVPGLMGGYHVMTVEFEDGKFVARDDALMAVLSFDRDWVCIALINLRGVTKLW